MNCNDSYSWQDFRDASTGYAGACCCQASHRHAKQSAPAHLSSSHSGQHKRALIEVSRARWSKLARQAAHSVHAGLADRTEGRYPWTATDLDHPSQALPVAVCPWQRGAVSLLLILGVEASYARQLSCPPDPISYLLYPDLAPQNHVHSVSKHCQKL